LAVNTFFIAFYSGYSSRKSTQNLLRDYPVMKKDPIEVDQHEVEILGQKKLR